MKILITSGGCKVPIDDVRHIGNFSSGRYGAEIAASFMRQSPDNHVYFVMEKGSKYPDAHNPCSPDAYDNINDYQYADYFEYVDKTKSLVKGIQPDIIISAAAISDYICDKQSGKISSDGEEMIIKLHKSEKVIASFRELAPKALIVGFKCLVSPTNEEKGNAITKIAKYTDLIVYNDLTELRKGNQARYLYSSKRPMKPELAKTASDLVEKILKLV